MIGTVTALRESVNPIVWLRAILMDLGFGGLIEEYEKRFGKYATNFLLGVLFVAIVLWGMEMVGGALVEVERLQATGSAWDMAKALGLRFGLLIALTAPVLGIMAVRLNALAKRHREDGARLNAEIEERLMGFFAEQKAEYRKRRAEIEKLNESVKDLSAAADRKIRELKEAEAKNRGGGGRWLPRTGKTGRSGLATISPSCAA